LELRNKEQKRQKEINRIGGIRGNGKSGKERLRETIGVRISRKRKDWSLCEEEKT
jgi:hypothetical protein